MRAITVCSTWMVGQGLFSNKYFAMAVMLKYYGDRD
jgi:hypothetical protein